MSNETLGSIVANEELIKIGRSSKELNEKNTSLNLQLWYSTGMSMNAQKYLFAEKEDKTIIGIITYSINPKAKEGEVLTFFVEEGYRKKGIGAKLLSTLKTELKKQKLNYMTVIGCNMPASPLYKNGIIDIKTNAISINLNQTEKTIVNQKRGTVLIHEKGYTSYPYPLMDSIICNTNLDEELNMRLSVDQILNI